MGLTGIPPAMFMRGGDPADPRSIRTRTQLLDAYERLLALDGSPTVAELVREAGVSRSSFYAHFTGIEEVGVAALRSILDAFEPLHAPRDNEAPNMPTAASFHDLFTHLGAHRRLCAEVLISDQQVPALAELYTTLVAHLVSALGGSPDRPAGFDVERGARFLVGGILALLVDDLQGPDSGSDRVGSTVAAMLPDWLSRANVLETPLSITPNAAARHR